MCLVINIEHAMLGIYEDRIKKYYFLCFRLQTLFKMGSKVSKNQDKNIEESAVALPQESTKDMVIEESPSFSRRFRSSCRNWATKKGLMSNNEPGRSETDSEVGRGLVVEVEFKEEVAYTCGEGEKVKDTPDNKGSDASDEVDISSVIKHLVIEAQKKKVASRPNSRIFECQTDQSEKKITRNENEDPSEENRSGSGLKKDTNGKKDICDKKELKLGYLKESADLIVVEKANVVTDNSGGEIVVIFHNVDKLSGVVVADSAADVFSSSQVLGREDNTLSLEGNINSENENDKTVKMLRMDNVTTEPEEESLKETKTQK